MKRIAKHKISDRISGWSVFIFVLGMLSVIAGIGTFIFSASDSEPLWGVSVGIIAAGLLLLASARVMEGFSVLVHNAEQQSVDSGDDTYLDFINTEEEKRDSETPAILPDKES